MGEKIEWVPFTIIVPFTITFYPTLVIDYIAFNTPKILS